ncbi:MAG: BatA domain-containing protein, partial [Planctomycetota bacterium]
MTFLSSFFLYPFLSLGALAFSVPLIIHLINRSRFRRVQWGAMHLLEDVLRTNTRRLQIQQWLLLLVRCMIPIFLAFMLALPLLPGCQSLPGDAPTALVIGIDTSGSMAAVLDPTEDRVRSRMDAAKEMARQIVRRAGKNSEFAILSSVDAAAGGLPPQFVEPQDAIDAIDQLSADGGPIRPDRFLRSALRSASEMKRARKSIVLISDYSANDWNVDVAQQFEQLADSLPSGPMRPTMEMLSVHSAPKSNSAGTASPANVFVHPPQLDQMSIGVGSPASIRVRVEN